MTWHEDVGSHDEENAGRYARAHAEDDWPIEDHSAPTGDALARLRALEAALTRPAAEDGPRNTGTGSATP